MLCLNSLTLSRNSTPLIKKLGITVFAGTCLIVKGKNGSGKTTLLNYISEANASSMIHVGHKNALTNKLTVRENLEYWAEISGGNKELILPASHVFGVYKYFDIIIDRLSQGWQRKVALTRLLLAQTYIWCLDEPYSNLDNEGSEILNNLIQSKCLQNGIVVIASHEGIDIDNSIVLDIDDFIF